MKRNTLPNLRHLLILICILFYSGNLLQAQVDIRIKVRGNVTDDKGESLPGVSVKVRGETSATATDTKGNFEISVLPQASLTFSFIGFKSQTVEVNSRQSVQVKLVVDNIGTNLNEVVVVGYGTQKRSDVTGSVTSVPKARLSQLPITNVLQAVQGAVAGITVSQTSSVPGKAPSALIRGQNSINANSGPYVVVDGIPLTKTGGTLNDINPNDIASMEILKDASSVAIYGTNGANGVILITTKRGTTGKPMIRYNAYAGVENIAHMLTPRNGEEYVQKYADWLKQSKIPQTNPVPNFGELENYNAGITRDWMDDVTQTGTLQDHNLSISGGSEDTKYYISGEFLNQKGVVQGFQYKRVNLRSNLDVNVTNYLTVGTSVFYTNNNTDGGRANLLNASAMSPYGQMYNTDGTYKIYPMKPEQLFANPMLGLVTDRLRRTTNVNGNGYAELKFSGALTGLKYRLNAGYSFLPERRSSYTGRMANDLIGTAEIVSAETNSYTLENIVSYTKDWNKNHFDFTGLYSSQQKKYDRSTAGAKGFVNDELSFNSLSAGATQTSDSYTDKYALNSQMGRLNYSYDSRYLFTVTARRDGSSVFGSNTTKHGIFPSAAIGWNISNESFMKNQSFVDNLKLRLSYGKSGNEAIPVYRTISTSLTSRSPFNGISTIGAVAGNLGNRNLLWENTYSKNLGVDFSILKNRIYGTVDVYDSKTTDLLLLRSIPIITGYSTVFDNLGETSNKGIEVTLNTRNINGTDFRWETTLNFSANKNKIVDLYGDKQSDLGNRWFIGQPINVIYDYHLQGIWQEGEDASTQDPGAVAGELKFADLNGDGKITANADREVIGQTAPKWTGGITNTFHYKNLHLNVFILTAQGMTKNNSDLNYADETGKRNTPIDIGYWTAENKSTTRPSLAFKNPRGYGYASDAAFTRIKDVTLSYVFNPKMLEKLHIGGLTVYASGRNLYTFTDWIGWDPESDNFQRGTTNSDAGTTWEDNYPVTRSFVFGANISLR
ncbi:SusC/RagA family TonB-linked outer membrane protein [Arcticibacter eurypsychrophilus]|uniref:SusC/RagA family TonB-linked outer membrane protein n=1 Tax=Arcticibacter eurypsychrophilus TaxID=1434752 RepID=UPI00084E0837|nr:TonB-dependent receptor [Arcticibacter eurypsychrophilus]